MVKNTCGDKCVYPVAMLNYKDMQTCSQKCSYYGNYNNDSDNNTIINEHPYTMAKSTYNGKSEVMFNGITYSNTDINNSIEIYITKPLHTFGEEDLPADGELIIAHRKSNSGAHELWVHIPITQIDKEGLTGSATNQVSQVVLEQMIKTIEGPPYVQKQKNNLLVRQADNSDQGYLEIDFPTTDSLIPHTHSKDDGTQKMHTHEFIPLHSNDPSEGEKAFLAEYKKTTTEGSTEIQNQSNLHMSYKLNDIIPNAPYYFYKGVFNSSGGVSYSSCANVDNNKILNVIVFDIKDSISVSEKYATMLTNSHDPTRKKTTYPLLLDHSYRAQPDKYKNVSYHTNPFKTSKSKYSNDDEIYIDCTPINYEANEKKSTILKKDTNNDVLDAGASISTIIIGFLNSSAFGLILGIIAMIVLFRSYRYLLQVIFGKKTLPTPTDITNKIEDVANPK